MTPFELSRRSEILPNYGPVNQEDIKESIESAFSKLFDSEEVTSAADPGSEVTSTALIPAYEADPLCYFAKKPPIESSPTQIKDMSDITTKSLYDEPVWAEEALPATKFTSRFADTLKTLFLHELPEKEGRYKKLGALALAGSTQFLDRGRALVFILPAAFDEALEYSYENGLNAYEQAGLAGTAIGAGFGAWGWLVGRSFHTSLNAFPKTTKKVTENHPTMVGVISRAIDGFPTAKELEEKQPVKPEEGYDVNPYETRKTLLGKAALGLTRGLKTAFLFGTTAHVGMSKVSGHSDKSNISRRQAATFEGSMVLGGIGAGLSAMLSNDLFGVAEEVREVITNEQYLLGASLGTIALATIGNYASRRAYEKQLSEQNS